MTRIPLVAIKDGHTPSVYNDPGLISTLVPVLKSAPGASAVHALDPVMAGVDLARYDRTAAGIPGAILWMGAVNENKLHPARNQGKALPDLHSARFAPDARPTIETGVRTMSAVLPELFRRH